MTSSVAVGIDVGTSGVKGVAIDDDGAVLARAEAGYPFATPLPGWVEQDPEEWWRATESVLAQLHEAAGAPVGIGLSGQMHGLVALDSADRVVRPSILWNDQRSAAQCDQIERTIGLERLVQLTGNRAIPGFTAPKMLWMRESEPDLWARVRRVMLPKDYVRLRLCGVHATDVSDASGTLLLDVGARAWSEEVLEALELDRRLLPEVLESPVISGTRADGVPVAAGAGDQAAGALGVGVSHPGPLSIVLGTSGVVFAASEQFRSEPEGRLQAFCHARPLAWHVMGVMLSAAGSLGWARDTLAPDAPFDELLAGADRWAPGVEGLIFLPYLAGERTPHVDPEARAAFAGMSLRHDRAALVRAVLEGVAFGLRDCLDLISGLGIETTLGRVSGGGARSRLWLQIVASALELPLEEVAVQEGAAFGAALLGGVAAGVWDDVDAAIGATVRPGSIIEPVGDWIEPYREALVHYRALYPALRDAARAGPADGADR
ncbi:MAG TPA: xylulokinase [Solirubrobacteraceae bacterium]|nr:xylulokinase [Solirubrobacteraceae bacterium]